MAIPSLPAQGAPWLPYATALDVEVRAVVDGIFTPAAYGTVDTTGVVDSTAAVQAAISAAAAIGGRLLFPEGKIRIDGQLVVPYTLDGTGAPKQAAMIWAGSGAWSTGRGSGIDQTIVGGTVLDLRYAGTGPKIVTKGFGKLEITGITFFDGGSGSAPFLKTTNTTLHVHGCTFWGNKSHAACDQDAIILGGTNPTNAVEHTTTDEGPFQGYGTIVEGNYFNHIRRAVLGQVFANGIIVRDNTVWAGSGSNLAAGACIEFNPGVAPGVFGNVIAGNLIEVGSYVYGIKLDYAQGCTITGNNFYDQSATTLAYIYTASVNAKNNMIVFGYGYTGSAWAGGVHVLEAVPGTNTYINATDGTSQFIGQPYYARGLRTGGAFNYGAGTPEATFGGSTYAPSIYVGNGSPAGVIVAKKGSLYLRLDGSTESPALYVMTAGDWTSTGWVAK